MAQKSNLLMCVVAMAVYLQAQGKRPPDVQASCREFVQSFYDWYVPNALKDNKTGPAWDLAVKEKSYAFSPELLRLLREDSKTQAKHPDEIVGLDADPFLSSQDPDDRYALGTIKLKGYRCWAEVYGIGTSEKRERPDVVAELKRRGGRWLFANFHYGKTEFSEDANLLSTLNSLRTDRQKQAK